MAFAFMSNPPADGPGDATPAVFPRWIKLYRSETAEEKSGFFLIVAEECVACFLGWDAAYRFKAELFYF